MTSLRQPATGLLATVIVIGFSLGLISLFNFATFSGWVSYALLCVIPMQIVTAVLWKTEHPTFLARFPQPLKGLLLLLMTGMVGVVVGTTYFRTVGGSVAPPSPMLAHCAIVSVVIMFWFAIIWGGWPFNAILRDPVWAGLAALAAAYLVNAALFRFFFSFEFMSDAPVYVASLDPQGMFNAWHALVFYVTALSIMFLMLHFDLWPLNRYPRVMKQPVLGAVWSLLSLGLGAALYEFGTGVFKMDAVQFLVRVPIPFIFGTIVVLNMMQNSLFGSLRQPMKGVANTVAALVVGNALALLYRSVAGTVTGELVTGPPAYEAEIWLASALLSVTFPFLIYYAEFFGFWPLKTER